MPEVPEVPEMPEMPDRRISASSNLGTERGQVGGDLILKKGRRNMEKGSTNQRQRGEKKEEIETYQVSAWKFVRWVTWESRICMYRVYMGHAHYIPHYRGNIIIRFI
jgi:hypothetical protein